jgi:hypothetical protein
VNSTQIGTAAQLEFVKLLILGSDGKIEASWPVTDDERRDLETHIHGEFGRSIAFQVKSSMHQTRQRFLAVNFRVAKARLVDHPLFWYSFSYLEKTTMAFADPLFLVPSVDVHAHALPRLRSDSWIFSFQASLNPASHDRWRPYAVSPQQAGKRVLQILRARPSKRTATASQSATRLSRLPGLLWVRRS